MKEDVQKVTGCERFLAAIAMVVIILVAFLYYLCDPQRLRGEEVTGTYPSPSGKYTVTPILTAGT